MDSDEKIVKALEKVFAKLGMSIPVIFKLKGYVLDDRFRISKSMTEGAFGKIFSGSEVVYNADDISQPNAEKKHSIVVKFTQSHAMNEREHEAHLTILNHIRSNYDARTCSNFAQLYTKGKVLVLDPKLCTLG